MYKIYSRSAINLIFTTKCDHQFEDALVTQMAPYEDTLAPRGDILAPYADRKMAPEEDTKI